MADFDSDDAIFDESFFDDEDEEEEQKGRVKMSRVKRDMKTGPIPTKVQAARQFAAKCVENAADLGDTVAESAAVVSAAESLETKYNTAQESRQTATDNTNIQNNAESALDTKVEDLMRKVESNTKGDKNKLIKTGLGVVEPGTGGPQGAPAQVANVRITQGDNPGELEISWNGLKPRPRLYLVRMCEAPYDQSKMQVIGMPSGSRYVKDGLTSGKEYWFEICGVGSGDQQGPWSGPENGRAD